MTRGPGCPIDCGPGVLHFIWIAVFQNIVDSGLTLCDPHDVWQGKHAEESMTRHAWKRLEVEREVHHGHHTGILRRRGLQDCIILD